MEIPKEIEKAFLFGVRPGEQDRGEFDLPVHIPQHGQQNAFDPPEIDNRCEKRDADCWLQTG